MNKVILTGYLSRDPELKYSKNDKAYIRTGIAVERAFSKEREVDFFNLIAFGKTAEFIGKYFKKGQKIFVEGQLRMSKYQDKEGKDRTSVDVWIDNAEFMSKKSDSSGGSSDDSSYRRNSTTVEKSGFDDENPPF